MDLAELSSYLTSLLDKDVLVTIGKQWTRRGPNGLVHSCVNLLSYAIKVPSGTKHYVSLRCYDVLLSLGQVLEYVCQ